MPAAFPAAQEEMFSTGAEVCSTESVLSLAAPLPISGTQISARACQGKKPHQGGSSKTGEENRAGNSSKSKRMLGMRGISTNKRVRENSLLQWNGQLFNYDLNGNMTSDGTNTYTWDARNQLSQFNTVGFQYDAAGRRTKNAVGNTQLYDGANSVQELSGTTVLSNRITGGVDEFFNRTESGNGYTPLTDALGSTIAMVNSSGSIITSYVYDPFGNTTVSGSSTNQFQYTGRENDSNGLYYYRARYYNPLIGRFISEDPLRFGGGDPNFYSYAKNSPTNFTDPTGRGPFGAIVGGVIGGWVGGNIGAGVGAAGGAVGGAIAGAPTGPGEVVTTPGGAAIGAGVGGAVGVGVGATVGAVVGSTVEDWIESKLKKRSCKAREKEQPKEVTCELVDEWEIVDPWTRQAHKVCEYQCSDGTPDVREGAWGVPCDRTITKTSQ